MHAFSACKNVLAKFQTSAHFYSLSFNLPNPVRRREILGTKTAKLHSSNGLIEVVLG